MYSIEIKHFVKNPLYDQQKEGYDCNRRFSQFSPLPLELIEVGALKTEISDEEFLLLRSDILEVWQTKKDAGA